MEFSDVLAKDIAIAVVFAISGWMLRMWLTHRETMQGLSLTKQRLQSSDDRLARVEKAVESIALEVERIGEGQRFVTKLLHERAIPLSSGFPERSSGSITPH